MHKYIKPFSALVAIQAVLVCIAAPSVIKAENAVPQVAYMRLTAYSSSPDETDYNPLYTADGTHVYDGVVAANGLPFGTKIQIPELFGDKIFTVHDRMAKRFQHTVDIWMTSKAKALYFGVEYANIYIWTPAGTPIAQTVSYAGRSL